MWRAPTSVLCPAALLLLGSGVEPSTTCDAPPPPPQPHTEPWSVEKAVVIFRHGARTPISVLPNTKKPKWDVPKKLGSLPQVRLVVQDSPGEGGEEGLTTLWQPEGEEAAPGTLTDLGIDQVKDLGAWLRYRYVYQTKFLPSSFDPSDVAAYSTNFTRTIQSCQGVLVGLYPELAAYCPDSAAGKKEEGEDEEGAADLTKRPLIITTDRTREMMFPSWRSCPCLQQIQAVGRYYDTKNKSERCLQIRDRVCEWFSAKPQERGMAFVNIHDITAAHVAHRKPLPHPGLNLGQAFIHRCATEEVSTRLGFFVDDNQQEAVQQFLTGPIASTILAFAADKDGPKLQLMSAHDTSLIPLGAALGRPSTREWPQYCSSIVVEFVTRAGNKGETEQGVRLLWNGAPWREEWMASSSGDGVFPREHIETLLRSFAVPPKDLVEVCDDLTNVDRVLGSKSHLVPEANKVTKTPAFMAKHLAKAAAAKAGSATTPSESVSVALSETPSTSSEASMN